VGRVTQDGTALREAASLHDTAETSAGPCVAGPETHAQAANLTGEKYIPAGISGGLVLEDCG
jgi:hypothetical protein